MVKAWEEISLTDKVWSKLDLYPIYYDDMIEILSTDFEVEDVFYDLGRGSKEKKSVCAILSQKKAVVPTSNQEQGTWDFILFCLSIE